MTQEELEDLKKKVYDHFDIDEKLINTEENQRLYTYYMEKNFGSINRDKERE